jgi:hypothetical protein
MAGPKSRRENGTVWRPNQRRNFSDESNSIGMGLILDFTMPGRSGLEEVLLVGRLSIQKLGPTAKGGPFYRLVRIGRERKTA